MIDTERRAENPAPAEPAPGAHDDALAYEAPVPRPAGLALANVAAALAALSVPLTFAALLGASLTWLAVLLAGPAIGLTVARDREADPRARRRARAAALWAVVLPVTTGGMLYALTPHLSRASEKANRALCVRNLRQIGEALNAYSLAHGGQYPPTFDELFLTAPFGAQGPLPWLCPSSADERPQPIDGTPTAQLKEFRAPGHNSYVYVIGGVDRATITADHVILYEDPKNHADGVHVLFGDGTVSLLSPKAARHLLAKIGMGRNPPR